MLFIGSYALKQHIDMPRMPKDIDVIGTYDDVFNYVNSLPGNLKVAMPFHNGKKYLFAKNDIIVEAEIAWNGSLAEEFLALMPNNSQYASLNGLYALKMSHRYLKNSKHFMKTMRDIKLMRAYGAIITDDLMDWFKRREAATYNYSHPNLNVNKKEFFSDDGINYVYDHDSIHEAIKHYEHPAYYYFKSNTDEVMVNRAMFEQLDRQIQLYSVLEESYVLAIERSQVPFPGVFTPRYSFDIALQKVCTSITSGWWRDFAWENFDAVNALYSDSYMKRFNDGIKYGVVKRISK